MRRILLLVAAIIAVAACFNGTAAWAGGLPTVEDAIAVLTNDSANDGNFATGYIYYMQAFNGSPTSDVTAPVITTTPKFSSTAYGFVSNGPYAGASTCNQGGVTCLSLFTKSEPIHPNEMAASIPYNASSPLTGPWTFHVSSATNFANGTVTTVTTNNLNGVQPIPFVQSATISTATGALTPTISWTSPTSSAEPITQEIISIADDSAPIQRYNINPGAAGLGVTPYGTYFNQAAIEYTTPALSTATTSYTLPLNNNNPGNANYGTGSTPVLQYGQTYTIGIQLENTYGPAVPNCQLCNVDSRSVSDFDYTPINTQAMGLGNAVINLPNDVTPIPTTSGLISNELYHFSVGSVGSSSMTFIDPLAAYGFVYSIGSGDPNFASVDPVTNVGGGVYQLWVWNGTQYVEVDTSLAAGTTFDFLTNGYADGVTQFEILGIDPNANLDPTDITAFVTGLTFAGPGSFTGTMQPLIEDTTTPLPGTWLLMLTGVLGFGFFAYRRNSQGGAMGAVA